MVYQVDGMWYKLHNKKMSKMFGLAHFLF